MSKRLNAAIDIRDRILKLMEGDSEWQSVGVGRVRTWQQDDLAAAPRENRAAGRGPTA